MGYREFPADKFICVQNPYSSSNLRAHNNNEKTVPRSNSKIIPVWVTITPLHLRLQQAKPRFALLYLVDYMHLCKQKYNINTRRVGLYFCSRLTF